MSTSRLQMIVGCAVGLWLVVACARSTPSSETANDPAVTLEEAQAIAKEAYIYAYPMFEGYRTMYVQAIDRNARSYSGPFNQIVHETQLLGPEFTDIVRPNNDTVYSFAWLDLRAEPMVITVPEIKDRYYSVQLVDMFTHNFAYMGTRATRGEAGSYLVAGHEWEGPQPKQTKEVFRSESSFVYCIVRVEVRGPDDLTTVNELQKGFLLTPLHVAQGRSRGPAASGITFPRYDADKAQSPGFIDLFNFLLQHVVVVPEEERLMQRFATIGIRPGATSESLRLEPAMRDALDAGVGQALVEIQKGAADPASVPGVRARTAHGWQGADGLFGDGATMRKRYLARAVAAMVGLYGNDAIEAYYPMASEDAQGRPFDGARHRYIMRFEKDEMPQVDAFWSMTMYGLPNQLMVSNPIHRYSIGDRSNLRYEQDGSLTIYIQHESPGAKHESNWLPAPNGRFSLQLRMYLPKLEALDPLYLPPSVQVTE